MANPFEIAVPNVLQALMAGNEAFKQTRGYRKEEELGAARQQAANELMNGGNTKSAIAKLLGIGDVQGASTIASMDQNQYNRDWQRQEADRAQRNQDRSFGMQEKQFQFSTTAKPEIRSVKDANGNETLVRITPDGRAAPLNTGIDAAAGNPFGGGKFNETQGKAAGFTDRMLQSEAILRGSYPNSGAEGPPLAPADVMGTDKTQYSISKLPDSFGGEYAKTKLHSDDYKKFEQAKRDFVNAQLRRESGAAISQSEFDSANKQYFPMPNDPPDVIEQKRANRRAAIEALGREGGPSYVPKSTFGQDGFIVPFSQGRKQSPPIQGAKQASDGNWYVPNPDMPGKFLKVVP